MRKKYSNSVPALFAGLMLVSIVACSMPAGSYSKSSLNGAEKVYRYDEGGKKVLVYEVDSSGKLTVHDENDPQAKQQMARQSMKAQAEQANADRIEKIRHAPKRRPNDPISVYLHQIELDEQLSKAERTKGAIFDQIKKEFEKDPIIRLVNKDKVKKRKNSQTLNALLGGSSTKAPTADVEVAIRGYMKEVHGLTKDGKPGKMMALVFGATITSDFVPDSFKVEESGNIFRNVEVTHKLGDKIKQVIKNQIGPSIPADRSL
jgi:hypothetical protein